MSDDPYTVTFVAYVIGRPDDDDVSRSTEEMANVLGADVVGVTVERDDWPEDLQC